MNSEEFYVAQKESVIGALQIVLQTQENHDKPNTFIGRLYRDCEQALNGDADSRDAVFDFCELTRIAPEGFEKIGRAIDVVMHEAVRNS